MDSMRSLNTSLPTPYTSRPVPPEHLLQAFKSAALSVTNLYKSAVQDQNNNRAAGYQDALDDLLRFLDSENLGLQDGEGWRVRQWVTERYDGTANEPADQSEDEKVEAETNTREHPVENHTSEPGPVSDPVEQQQSETHADIVQQNKTAQQQNETHEVQLDLEHPSFRFRYPSDSALRFQAERETLSAPPLSSPVSDNEMSGPTTHRPSAIPARGNRTSQRTAINRQTSRPFTKAPGSGTGMKRKNPFPELNFFDIANLGPRDGPDASAKRGRYA